MLIGVSIYYYNYRNSGYAVRYQGKLLGYVRDKNKAYEELETVKSRLKGYDPSIDINDQLEFEKINISASKLTDEKSAIKSIESSLYSQYTCYSISVNGSEIATVRNEDDVKKIADGVKRYFEEQEASAGTQVLKVDIKDEIKAEKRLLIVPILQTYRRLLISL